MGRAQVAFQTLEAPDAPYAHWKVDANNVGRVWRSGEDREVVNPALRFWQQYQERIPKARSTRPNFPPALPLLPHSARKNLPLSIAPGSWQFRIRKSNTTYFIGNPYFEAHLNGFTDPLDRFPSSRRTIPLHWTPHLIDYRQVASRPTHR